MTHTLPTLFLSHGAPDFVLARNAWFQHMQALGKALPRPQAIVMISAHWDTPTARVSAAAKPATIHDFHGFPEALYRLTYPAPGAPALAERITRLLQAAGIEAGMDPQRGLDHGAWSVLMPMFPDADIPVLQVSVQTRLAAAHHLAVGAALAPLRAEGVLLIGSGGATHDLRGFGRYPADAPPPDYVAAFADWLRVSVTAGNRDALARWQQAPEAQRNHPGPEHFLPLLVAAGAGDAGRPGRSLWQGTDWGILTMDAYAFD